MVGANDTWQEVNKNCRSSLSEHSSLVLIDKSRESKKCQSKNYRKLYDQSLVIESPLLCMLGTPKARQKAKGLAIFQK